MTTAQKIEKVKAITHFYHKTQSLADMLNNAMGLQPEGKLLTGVWYMFEKHLRLTKEILQDTESKWLDWWIYECDGGKTPTKAGIGDEENLQVIDSVQKLVELMEVES